MHTTTRDVAADADAAKALSVPIGTNILTSVLEGDGAVALCSDNATLSARVISVARTESGGIQVQTAVLISEPTPAAAPPPPPPPPTAEEQAIAFLISEGNKPNEAKDAVAQFGTARILAMREKKLDDQLSELVK